MSVSAAGNIGRKLWQGFPQRNLPIGAWETDQGVTGNASGGSRTIVWTFAQQNEANAIAWSIEQIAVQDLRDANTTFQLFTSGFDLLTHVSVNLRASASGSFATVPLEDMDGLPIFLGVPNKAQGVGAATLYLQLDNSNGALCNARLQGYIWGPRTTSAAGGYLRPRGPW